MKQVIKSFWRLCTRRRGVGEDTKRLPSLVKAMKTLVPRSVIKEVVASSSDRRQWGVLAAAWVGVSEREFVHAAAQELRMPYQDHVVAPDLTPFGVGARTMLSALRNVGAMVVVQGTEIVGFVATDPAEIRGLDLYDGTQNITMAPWTEIAKALEMCERMLSELEANRDRNEALRRRQLIEQVVDLLISEAAQYGSTSVEILSAEGMNRYQFRAADGKMGIGSIKPEALQSMMLAFSARDGESFTHRAVGQVLIRTMGSAANVKLSWGVAGKKPALEWHPNAPSSEVVSSDEKSKIVATRGEPNVDEASGASSVPVLVIDDNPMFRRVLERLLKRENFEVSFAENGRDAFEKLATLVTFLPRVIVCDLHMPTMNGREFVARLKEEPRLRAIPVVMLTSDDGVDAEISALELGVDALISKSKDPRVLCAQVLRLSKMTTLLEAA